MRNNFFDSDEKMEHTLFTTKIFLKSDLNVPAMYFTQYIKKQEAQGPHRSPE
jgi:hypothetical protein